jgi:hypothetical protein
MTPSLLDAALENASCGFRVLPVEPRGKKPMWKGWSAKATTDPGVIRGTWDWQPQANVGIACGGGLLVIDLDGPRAGEALSEFGLPQTTEAVTRRGRHLYFRGDAPTRLGLLPGVDVKGAASYVVAPGSIHPSGHRYRWQLPPWELEPARAPTELVERIRTAAPIAPPARLPTVILEGSRNATLFRLGCSLQGRWGLPQEVLMTTLEAINRTGCRPPLPDRELEQIGRSAAKYPVAPRWVADPAGFCVDDRLGAHARHILRLLCDHARDDGTCYPSIRRLSDLSGMAKATVQKAIVELKAHGRIRVARWGQCNVYTLIDDSSTALPPQGTGSSVLPLRTVGGPGA